MSTFEATRQSPRLCFYRRELKSKGRRDLAKATWISNDRLGSKPALLTSAYPAAYLTFSFSLNVTGTINRIH